MEDKKLIISNMSKEKNQINYSRDYRYLGKGRITCFVQFFLVIIPVLCVYLLNYDKISYFMAKYAAKFIGLFTEKDIELVKMDYLPKLGDIHYVALEGKHPSFMLSIISFFVTLLSILIFSLIKTKKKSIVIFMLMGLYIHLCSSIYFLVFPGRFPYDLNKYSELYIKNQIFIWLLIMVTYWFTTSLITKMFGYRLFTFVGLIITDGVFGFVRYVLYLTFLSKCSYLFMAILYFIFGFLFDFIIMIAFYAIYMKKASTKFSVKAGGELWKWS